MTLDVTVLRVFTNADGDYGNPLGVVDANLVTPADRQRVATELGYSETIFIDPPSADTKTTTAHIFTPTVELPFAGHPTVGASWWLKDRGTPVEAVLDADPDDFTGDAEHYVGAWVDKAEGTIRSRSFASNLGIPEDEATGSAAVRLTDYLSRDLMITQGKGSQLRTNWAADGWVKVAGRVVDDGIRGLD